MYLCLQRYEKISPAKTRNMTRCLRKVSMKESGKGSVRILEDLGKVLGGVLEKGSSGSKRIRGTKYLNPKDGLLSLFCTHY